VPGHERGGGACPDDDNGDIVKVVPTERGHARLYDLIDAAKSFLVFGRRFGSSGCVLRTASVSISRSSAFVFGCSRVKVFCHWVIDYMWGCRRVN
jgi:hypothetical protein